MCKKETEEEIIENHQTKIAYRNMEKETMEMQSNQKTKDKIDTVSPKYKWTELTNQKVKSSRMDYKVRPNSMLPSGNSSQLQRQTQTQSKGVEDNTLSKWNPEKSWCSHTYIRQNVFQETNGHFLMIKGTIQQEYTALINICAPNL